MNNGFLIYDSTFAYFLYTIRKLFTYCSVKEGAADETFLPGVNKNKALEQAQMSGYRTVLPKV